MPDLSVISEPSSADPYEKLVARLKLWNPEKAALVAQVALPAVVDIIADTLNQLAALHRSGEVGDWDIPEWLETEASTYEALHGTRVVP